MKETCEKDVPRGDWGLVGKSGKGNLEKKDLFESSRCFRNILREGDGQFISHVSKGRATMDLKGRSAPYHCGEKADDLSICSLGICTPCNLKVPLQH